MKKTLLVLSTILAMSLVFVGCPKDPKDPGTSVPELPTDPTDPIVPEDPTDPTDPIEPIVPEELVIFETPQTESGNIDFTISAADFTKYIGEGYTKIVFTLKNTFDGARDGWGVFTLVSQETTGGYTWHNIANNENLGTNEYGQLALPNFPAGETKTLEVDLATLKAEVAKLGETNRLAMQTSNDVILLKISLK